MSIALPDAYPFLADPLKIGTIVALILFASAFLFIFGRVSWLSRIHPKPLLAANEVEFFHRLQRALPTYQVFPQVAFWGKP